MNNFKKENLKYIINIILPSIFIVAFCIISILTPDTDISISERRKLKQFPKLNKETVFNKSADARFMNQFDEYVVDQFPERELFRNINSITNKYLLLKAENNNLYCKNGIISKLEYSKNQASYDWSLNRITTINNKYLANSNVYMTIIPDKNYYLQTGIYPSYDYDEFMNDFKNDLPENIKYIDITNQLNINDYYLTDTHWRQENLIDLSKYILENISEYNDFGYLNSLTPVLATDNFKGVYYGQLALPVNTDSIYYLDGNYIKNIKAYCYDTGKELEIPIYDLNKTTELDPYELFLTGSKALIKIENPNALNDKELIVFRDSFGSSIAPIFAGAYKKITLVDIRYISPAMLDKYMDFDNNDVLFMYCNQVLNNSVGQFNN